MIGGSRKPLSLSKRKRAEESGGAAAAAVSQTQAAEVIVIDDDECAVGLEAFIAQASEADTLRTSEVTQVSVTQLAVAEAGGISKRSIVTNTVPSSPHTFTTAAAPHITDSQLSCEVCAVDLTGMSLLQREVHRNSCLDGDGDWSTQKAYAVDVGGADDGDVASECDDDGDCEDGVPKPPLDVTASDDVEVIAAAVVTPQPPPVAAPAVSAFAVMMAAAREQATSAVKAVVSAVTGTVTALTRQAQQPRKPCPFYKRIPGTPFVVDGFHFASKALSAHYILTHFHRWHLLQLECVSSQQSVVMMLCWCCMQRSLRRSGS